MYARDRPVEKRKQTGRFVGAPVGLYESRQPLGAEPEDPDNERVAVRHDDGRKKKHDYQLVPGERDACYVAAEVSVHTRCSDNVAVSVVEERVERALYAAPLYT